MRTLSFSILLASIIGLVTTSTYAAYQHGFYVGSIDALANKSALQSAGYDIPFHVDSNDYALIK